MCYEGADRTDGEQCKRQGVRGKDCQIRHGIDVHWCVLNYDFARAFIITDRFLAGADSVRRVDYFDC